MVNHLSDSDEHEAGANHHFGDSKGLKIEH